MASLSGELDVKKDLLEKIKSNQQSTLDKGEVMHYQLKTHVVYSEDQGINDVDEVMDVWVGEDQRVMIQSMKYEILGNKSELFTIDRNSKIVLWSDPMSVSNLNISSQYDTLVALSDSVIFHQTEGNLIYDLYYPESFQMESQIKHVQYFFNSKNECYKVGIDMLTGENQIVKRVEYHTTNKEILKSYEWKTPVRSRIFKDDELAEDLKDFQLIDQRKMKVQYKK